MAADTEGTPRRGLILADRFRLDAQIGGGSFGAVWRAVDRTDDAPVAIKLLHPSHAHNPKVVARFEQEARIQAELDHPGIVKVLGWGARPLPFLVMPLVDGQSLHDRCFALARAGRRMGLTEVISLIEQITGAVAVAHDAGVVHRDLKPKNVLVHRAGELPFVKVLDFGIAKILEGGQVQATTAGRVMGSVLYLAPEQITSAGSPTVAVDQFALASIGFELLTGRRAWARDVDDQPLPFDVPVGTRGENRQLAVLRRIVHGEPPRLARYRPELGPRVEAALLRGLGHEPKDRFDGIRRFGAELVLALTEAERAAPADSAGDVPPGGDASAPEAETVDLISELTLSEGPPTASRLEATVETRPPRRSTDAD